MFGISILTPDRHVQWTVEQSELHLTQKQIPVPVGESSLDGLSIHIEKEPSGLTLRNFGNSLVLHSGPRLHRGASMSCPFPLNACVGNCQIHLYDPLELHPLDASLDRLQGKIPDGSRGTLPVFGTAPSAETLASWLDSIGQIQRVAAGSQDFFNQLAQALFNPGGLDGGLILVPDGSWDSGWRIEASFIPYPEFGLAFREDLVQKAFDSKTSLFHNARSIDQKATGVDNHACVICPVPGPEGEVEAIIYGFRSQHRVNNRRGIRALEAQFVQVLADSMSASLVRLNSEKKLASKNALLNQAFAPTVAHHLQRDRSILEGSTRDVTVLFADLRGFSSLSEKIGAKLTYQLMNELMDHVTNIIEDHDGVVIDYYGDGVSAFWNAPVENSCHPLIACETAMSLLQSLPEFNESWAPRLGHGLRMGIGIHTGSAMVGNSGSYRRIKYGPRGNTVNIAARLESATKQLRTSLLVSGETARQTESVMKRRVCTTCLKGIRRPIELWEIFDPNLFFTRQSNFEQYADALTLFENSEFEKSLNQLQLMKVDAPCDPVVSFLLQHAQVRLNPKLQETSVGEETLIPLTIKETHPSPQATEAIQG